jgi:hypothetical protein
VFSTDPHVAPYANVQMDPSAVVFPSDRTEARWKSTVGYEIRAVALCCYSSKFRYVHGVHSARAWKELAAENMVVKSCATMVHSDARPVGQKVTCITLKTEFGSCKSLHALSYL